MMKLFYDAKQLLVIRFKVELSGNPFFRFNETYAL
jgi:hypothetical protein